MRADHWKAQALHPQLTVHRIGMLELAQTERDEERVVQLFAIRATRGSPERVDQLDGRITTKDEGMGRALRLSQIPEDQRSVGGSADQPSAVCDGSAESGRSRSQ